MRKPLIVGNWKMNGDAETLGTLFEEISAGVADSTREDVVVCPPFVFLERICQAVRKGSAVKIGAQDVSEHAKGAYTAEVSAAMLREFGCEFVIVGHSERRQHHGETGALIARKAAAAISCGLVPVACVGETLAQRESGMTRQVINAQVEEIAAGVGPELLDRVEFAYEPVWAIGTGKVATGEQAQEVHEWMRATISAYNSEVAAGCRILYGGSVTGENAASLLDLPDIDGCLVGGASLRAGDFLEICQAASQQEND